jgi:hypothetical protein
MQQQHLNGAQSFEKPILVWGYALNAVLLYRLVHKSATILSIANRPIWLYRAIKPVVSVIHAG